MVRWAQGLVWYKDGHSFGTKIQKMKSSCMSVWRWLIKVILEDRVCTISNSTQPRGASKGNSFSTGDGSTNLRILIPPLNFKK